MLLLLDEATNYSAQTTGLSNIVAKKIDKKFDDDDPLAGVVLAPICTMANHTATGTYFSRTSASFNSTYLLTNEDPSCVITFLINL